MNLRYPLFLLSVALLTAPQLSAAPQRTEITTTVKTRAFKPAKLVSVFRRGSELQRNTELAIAAAELRNPGLADALLEAIRLDVKRKRLATSTLEATDLFCALDADRITEDQLDLAGCEITPIAVAAASRLAKRGIDDVFEPLTSLAKRPGYQNSFAMRRAVADGVSQFKMPEAVDYLIAAHKQHGGQLRYEVTKHLMRLTGQNHGGYSDRWQDWWQENRETFDLNSATGLFSVASMPWPGQVPTFFEVPIHAYRVMFVIDRSKSMESTVGSETRMKRVQEEICLLYTSPSPRDRTRSRMPSSA